MNKALLCFLVATAYTAVAVPVDTMIGDVDSPRFIEFTDEDGVSHTIDLEEEPDDDLLEEANKESKNQYLLFTRRNPETPQNLVPFNEDSILKSNFNPEAKTVVIVHGWMSSQESNMNQYIKDATLGQEDANVIVVDWRHLAVNVNYVTAVRGVPAVGRFLGEFLNYLNEVTSAPLNKMHLVGFSLGAHVAGNAGRELKGNIARITALDAAGPLWRLNPNGVSSKDAVYVEGIHTDGTYEGLGIGLSVGDVDFFVNGGEGQPGCLTSICSHNRAWRLFAASVSYNHLVGKRCSNIIQVQINMCRGAELHMGNNELRKDGSGRYRANTRWRYPY